MTIGRFAAILLIFLVVGESIARLSELTTPRTVAKPYSNAALRKNVRFRFMNDLGNQSRIDRGAGKKVGLFSNSFSLGEIAQEDIWPELLQREYPEIHIENYAATGARYAKVRALLEESIRRKDRFDALFVILDLHPFKVTSETPFHYSSRHHVCDFESSCLVKRLASIIDSQIKLDPIFVAIQPMLREGFISSAQAIDESTPLTRQLLEKRSSCYADLIPQCQRQHIKARIAAVQEAKAQGNMNISRKMKDAIYANVFQTCSAGVDHKCEIRRSAEPPGFRVEPNEIADVVKQLRDLQALADQLSDNVKYVASPFGFSDEIDPMNLATIHHVEQQWYRGDADYYSNENMARALGIFNQVLRMAFEAAQLPIVEVQGPIDEVGREQIVYDDLGHLSALGQRIAKNVFADELRRMGIIESRGPATDVPSRETR